MGDTIPVSEATMSPSDPAAALASEAHPPIASNALPPTDSPLDDADPTLPPIRLERKASSKPNSPSLSRSLSSGISPRKAIRMSSRPAPLPDTLEMSPSFRAPPPDGHVTTLPDDVAVDQTAAPDHALNDPPTPQITEPTPPHPPVLTRTDSYQRKISAGLERSLSSHLSPGRPIKLLTRPAPLPEALSPAELIRTDSNSPRVHTFGCSEPPTFFSPPPTRLGEVGGAEGGVAVPPGESGAGEFRQVGKGQSLEAPPPPGGVSPVQTKPIKGVLSKLLFGSPKKGARGSSVNDSAPGGARVAPVGAGIPDSTEVWSSITIGDSPSARGGWRKSFETETTVPPWAKVATDDLIQRAATPHLGTIFCYVTRKKDNTYTLFTQENAATDRQLLTAKYLKRRACSEYVIAHSAKGLETKHYEDGYCGTVRSNLLGTRFQFYDHTVPEGAMWTEKSGPHTQGAATWQAATTTVAGGWRRLQVAVASAEEGAETVPAVTKKNVWSPRAWEALEGERRCSILQSKEPTCVTDKDGRLMLHYDYGGRCTIASSKNFQLVAKNDTERVVLLFGRVESDTFVMDYSYPLSAFQAFCICMTSVDNKLCFAL